MSSKPAPFHPYANEAEVRHVGALMVENRLDRVTLSGELDLTRDQHGLANARQLAALLADIVRALEAQSLPAQLPTPPRHDVANPFD